MAEKEKDSGEVMIEATLVMVVTLFLLIWIMSLGLMFYERSIVTITTNDAAAKIAATYTNPTCDIITGYISSEEFSDRTLYRQGKDTELESVNRQRCGNYVTRRIQQAYFAGRVEDVGVDMKLIIDSTLRRHVEVKTVVSFNTPLAGIFDLIGFDARSIYTAYACADCTDIIDYITTVDYKSYVIGGNALGGDVTKMLKTLMSVYNHHFYEN